MNDNNIINNTCNRVESILYSIGVINLKFEKESLFPNKNLAVMFENRVAINTHTKSIGVKNLCNSSTANTAPARGALKVAASPALEPAVIKYFFLFHFFLLFY